MDSDAQKRQRIRRLQKYLINPPVKAGAMLGLAPGHAVVETVGRISGRRRRTVVGYHLDGQDLWVVAEQGRYAHYVRNIEANPKVRVRLHGRWVPGEAHILDADDPQQRLDSFGRASHARVVRSVGTSLLTVRIRVDGA